MISLANEEDQFYRKQKVCNMCKKEFSTDGSDKKYYKVRSHCHFADKFRGAAHNICNIRYKTSKESPIVFHNGSKYDYHFIIEELAEEFRKKYSKINNLFNTNKKRT